MQQQIFQEIPQSINPIVNKKTFDFLFMRLKQIEKILLNIEELIQKTCQQYINVGRVLFLAGYNLQESSKSITFHNQQNGINISSMLSQILSSLGKDLQRMFENYQKDLSLLFYEYNQQLELRRILFLQTQECFIQLQSSEERYIKLKNDYYRYVKKTESRIQKYQSSQKEAKSLSRWKKMKRYKKLTEDTQDQLQKEIIILNNLKNAASDNMLIIIQTFKSLYQFALTSFQEQIFSIFAQNIEVKLESFINCDVPSAFPDPNNSSNFCSSYENVKLFKEQSPTHLTQNEFQQQLKQNQRQNISIFLEEIWPKFIQSNFKIDDESLIHYSDCAQAYIDYLFKILAERRGVIKSVKNAVGELQSQMIIFVKEIQKFFKNYNEFQQMQFLGKNIQITNEFFMELFQRIINETNKYSNYLKDKESQLEASHLSLDKNSKIIYSTLHKGIQDHQQIRNNLLKAANKKEKMINQIIQFNQNFSMDKINQILTEKKEFNDNEFQIRSMQIKIRQSILETNSIIKTLVIEIIESEGQEFEEFKETAQKTLSHLKKMYQRIVVQFNRIESYTNVEELIEQDEIISFINQPEKTKKIIQEFKGNNIKFFKIFYPDQFNIKKYDKFKQPEVLTENEQEKNSEKSISIIKQSNSQNNSHSDEQIKKQEANTLILGEINNQEQNQSLNNKENDLSNQKTPNLSSSSKLQKSLQQLKSPEQGNGSLSSNQTNQKSFGEVTNILSLKKIDPPQLQKNSIEEVVSPSKRHKKLSENEIFIKKKFGLQEDELIQEVYRCSLVDKILLQGKMYITNRKICFYSNFNRKNIFFGGTRMIIPKSEILYLEKKQTAFIFNNAIAFFTKNGSITFASFMNRNTAFDKIIKIVNPSQQPLSDFKVKVAQSDSSEHQNINELELSSNKLQSNTIQAQVNDAYICNTPEDEEKIQQEITNLKEQLDKRQQEIIDSMPDDDSSFAKEQERNMKFHCNIRTFFQAILSDNPFKLEQKMYENFLQYYKQEVCQDKEIQCSRWMPYPPDFFQNCCNIQQLLTFAPFSTREVKYSHPVKVSMPFVPKMATVFEEQQLYWLSVDLLIWQIKSQAQKIPFSNNFYVISRIIIKKLDDKLTDVTIQIKIVFTHKTHLQGIITKQTYKENNETISNFLFPSFEKAIIILKQNKIIRKKSGITQAISQQTVNQITELTQQQNENNKTTSKINLSLLNKNKILKSLIYIILILLICGISLFMFNQIKTLIQNY